MPFKKGHVKVGGRKKGTPSKKSLLVREILENNGINLIEKIIEILPALEPEEKVRALIQLLPYVHPKLTSVEVNGLMTLEDLRPLRGAENEELDVIIAEATQVEPR